MIRTAILGASGYVGGELLRLLAAHPELARRESVRRQPGRAGARRGPSAPRGGLIQISSSKSSTHAALADVDLVFAALPHGQSQKLARRDPRSRHSVRRSRRGLSAQRRCRPTSAGTAMRMRRPTCSREFVYGIPELNRDGDPRRKDGRGRRLLRDRRDPRAEAAGRCRPHQARQHHRRRRFGRQRCRARG